MDFNTIVACLVNVALKRGDAVSFTIPLYDPNNNNAPVDLSVYTRFLAQVKVDGQRDAAIMELDSDNSEITVSTNSLTFIISTAKSTVNRGKYVWDVQGIDASAKPTTLIEGDFEISQDTTRIIAP